MTQKPPVSSGNNAVDTNIEESGGIIQEQVVRTPDDTSYVEREHSTNVVLSARERQQRRAQRVKNAIFFVTHVIAIFTAIRLLLQLAGANPDNGFVGFVTIITAPFTLPFANLFGVPAPGYDVSPGSLLVAIPIYYLFAWIISKVVTSLMMRSVRTQYKDA